MSSAGHATRLRVEECAACGHAAAEHLYRHGRCGVDVVGLTNERRRCTCTFVRRLPLGEVS